MFFKSERRRLNEKKFFHWINLPNGGRKYWYEVSGRGGYKARYVKEVDNKEETIRFYQEIYDESGVLVELHEKYPINKGHRRLKEDVKDDSN